MAKAARTLEDFRKSHDPSFKHDATISPIHHREINWKKARRAIVVAAQNATPVHGDFWAVLNHMAAELNAELIVIPLRYKNPTSVWTGSQQNADWYAPEVRPYLWNTKESLNDQVMILGDIRIQPTTSNPLAGADALSGIASCVVGHTRAQSRSVAMMGMPAKFITTSGACTVSNYTDTRVGRLGDFHHSLSAILIEVKGKTHHMRRLNYSERSGRVIDLGIAYYKDRKDMAPPSLALVMGDTHVDYIDPKVVEATWGDDGIVARIRPKHLGWHDLLDGHTCNPHHLGDPFADIAKYYGGRSEVNGETTRAIEFVREKTERSISITGLDDLLSFIVPANHIDFLKRWIMKSDWKLLPAENRAFYLRTALHMAENTKLTHRGIEYPDPFTSLFNAAKVPNAIALSTGQPFRLADVDLTMHGDKGPNGSRGSRQNLKRVATKSIIGHSHGPGEDEGCTQTGTSTYLTLEYNAGSPSNWMQAHCELNADGKRQLIIIRDGAFCH